MLLSRKASFYKEKIYSTIGNCTIHVVYIQTFHIYTLMMVDQCYQQSIRKYFYWKINLVCRAHANN